MAKRVLFLALVSIALVQAFAYGPIAYSSDDCSYLDQARYFSHFDWLNGVNGYWSPLYPFVLGLLFKLFNTSSQDHASVAKFVNVAIFIGLFFAFDFFLRQFILLYKEKIQLLSARARVSDRQWMVVSYSLFAWVFLAVMAINQSTPDQLVAISFFLSTAIVMQIYRDPKLWRFALLGVALGMGYLAKAVMVPAVVTFIFLSTWKVAKLKQKLVCTLITVASAALVASPYITALTIKTGRFAVGSSAGLNYMLTVACRYRPLGPNPEDVIKACPHPIKMLSTDPDIAEFGGVFDVTFPPWYDPGYFAEGLKVTINPVGSIISIVENIAYIFYVLGWELMLAWIVGFIVSRRFSSGLKDLNHFTIVWLPALVTGMALSAIIGLALGFTCQRYFSFIIVMLYLTYLCACKFSDDERGSRALKASIATLCIIAITFAATRIGSDMVRAFNRPPDQNRLVASQLIEMGAKPGDKVAVIGRDGVEWARYADLRIVAYLSMYEHDGKNEKQLLKDIVEKFKPSGARTIVYFRQPVTEYVIEETAFLQNFRELIAKIVGGKAQKIQVAPFFGDDAVKDWHKLDGLDIFVYRY
ncbi:MAG: hypothetical protein K2X93_02325 [Candidatus Obscuribacterales bacterium]|nr:hypothetical protein [Candidatus Obscuribacterales bacterium]